MRRSPRKLGDAPFMCPELRAASVSDTDETAAAPQMTSESAMERQHRRPGLVVCGRSPESSQQEFIVTEPDARPTVRRGHRRAAKWASIAACAVLVVGVAVPIALKLQHAPLAGSTRPIRFLGLYERDMDSSYAVVATFTRSTGVKPDILTYYGSWLEPFQTSFAATAAQHGAIP